MLVALAGWIRFRFGVVTLQQIVSNLPRAGGESLGNGNLAVEAATVCLLVPAVIITSGCVWQAARRRLQGTHMVRRAGALRRHPWGVSLLAFAVGLGVLLTVAGVPRYASALLADESFASYYRLPSITRQAAHPKNLVTIYLESGENTFGDASLFGQDLLADLDDATRDWARYDNLQQFPGGGWTMAGMVATQCGIPLKSELLTPNVNHNIFGEQVDSYLPGATCLGSLLHEAGYTNTYLGGANSRFAGKDTFLTDHGFDQIFGLENWEADGEDPANVSVWGLSDHQLFSHAKQRIDALRSAGGPFSLTMLTLDTHEPAGVYPTCQTDDPVLMATAIKCSMRAVADFIDYLRRKDYLDDTVVMIMGDHLKATSEGGYYEAELDSHTDRTIILRVWSPESISFTREHADQLSILPTTLDLLGMAPPDGRAGLGVSLLESHDLTDTALALPAEEYADLIDAPSSDLYRQFWQKP